METDRINSPHGSRRRFAGFFVLAILLSLAGTLPFAATQYESREFYFFDVDLTADHPGMTQVFFDLGRGVVEADSSIQPLKVTQKPTRYRYLLPPGIIKELRFDFNNRPGKYSFAHARITKLGGQVLHEFGPTDFHADNQIKTLSTHEQWIDVETGEKASDPYIYLRFESPLELRYGWREAIFISYRIFLSLLLGICLLAFLIDWIARRYRRQLGVILTKISAQPKTTFALLAALSVLWQVHPVVFSGKSFASPNAPAFLLYDSFPTLPQYTSSEVEDQKGSDVGAFLYQHLHFPALQKRALLKDHELPLWNRYDLGGTPLLGQGQTMFGEILNFIPMFAGSAAWAWDVKFILARWIFAFALAFFVWKVTGHRTAANLLAVIASWIGFFSFRQTHPAQFAVCFGPLILLAWALLAQSQGKRQSAFAALALTIANWEVMTSGTVKEAYMMILCLNFAGLLYLLVRVETSKLARRKVTIAAITGFILILISAPLWWIFLDTLRLSSTSYDAPLVNQIPGWQFIGVFEEMFYRRLDPLENYANPSTNIIVLLGAAWLVASAVFTRSRLGWSLIFAGLLPASFAFGLVPAAWILRTPFLANIYHVGNTFSCPLVVILLAAAGVGLADFSKQLKTKLSNRTFFAAAALIIISILVYEYRVSSLARSAFYSGYTASLLVAFFALGGAIFLRRTLSNSLFALVIAGCLAVFLWRHGQYNHTPFDEYVFNPQVRVDLHAPSPAITRISNLETEPARIAGFDLNLYNGANQLYFQEGIYGVEAVRNRDFDDLLWAADLPKVRIWGGLKFGGERDHSRGTMDMLNVHYYLDRKKSVSPAKGLDKLSSEDLEIYSSPTVWPRAFFTTNLVDEGTLPELAQKLNMSAGVPFAAIAKEDAVHLEQMNIYRNAEDRAHTSPARNYLLTTNSTAFTVDADAPGVIVLSESYYPRDFQAFLNDKRTDYLRINHAFKGLAVSSPGTYEVRFEYWPHHLTMALLMSLAGCLGGLILFVTSVRKERTSASISAAS